MRYISENSRRGLVNFLAEKISKKLSENEKYQTSIEVVDCINFFVIKGYTLNAKVLNLSEFKNEFTDEENKFIGNIGHMKLNFIDVIDYKTDFELEEAPRWFEFWNSKRPIYNKTIIDLVENNKFPMGSFESITYDNQPIVEIMFPSFVQDLPYVYVMSPLTISSHFPFGYSLSAGKTKLYYCEYICNQLFSILNTNRIMFKITNSINENGDLDIEILTDSQYFDGDVKSMVLDIFDFNLTKFKTDYLKDYDFIQEIKNPFELKPWLNKDKVRELMIV